MREGTTSGLKMRLADNSDGCLRGSWDLPFIILVALVVWGNFHQQEVAPAAVLLGSRHVTYLITRGLA